MLARDPQTLGPLPPLLGLEDFQSPAVPSVVAMMILTLRRADGSVEYVQMPPGLQERAYRHVTLEAIAPRSGWVLERWEQTECEGKPCFLVHYQEVLRP